LPGNNDSGGLSTCYLWNFLGLFPISGQNSVFVGVPKAERAVLHLSSGKDLTILSQIKNGQVEKVVFNGKEVTGGQIPVKDILNGGEIRFF
jgi:putative alpha-1,2-mannosidase